MFQMILGPQMSINPKITNRWILMLLSILLITNISFIAITRYNTMTNPVDSFSKYIGIHQLTARGQPFIKLLRKSQILPQKNTSSTSKSKSKVTMI